MIEYFNKHWRILEEEIEEVEECMNGTAKFIAANKYGIKGNNVVEGENSKEGSNR